MQVKSASTWRRKNNGRCGNSLGRSPIVSPAPSLSLSLRSWISHENQSRTESFRPVYRINLRPVLVTFAESLAELGGADGSTKKRRRFQPAFRNKNETVGNFALSLARFEIEGFAILPSRGLRSRMKEERRTVGLEQEGGSRCRSGITHVLSIPAIPTTRRSSYASLIAVAREISAHTVSIGDIQFQG